MLQLGLGAGQCIATLSGHQNDAQLSLQALLFIQKQLRHTI
ncbi:hypothetical protein DFO67_12615 [Modicisalibacter xianhensis]|uniref:Uncharacterized protein n=1 Tax=Modicisalibacter xianhensis TaxID=442341 RepID=A0A4R8FH39_9GAMM|nr:hypothetical protein DFO67_12615 [Halomonas xianhensis]